ncbi:putative E3 ubiquitin-protein ligase ARI4 [Staphylotrichum tortipilum]|uniref:E3 ubiquitin-protein ligase ARI4 n=1 Tax=Staphylotrichum tortipilum TaxID=2831512 RepID=A0AAN6MDF0_9PEZI|nr:putative E3 ubiquitin-protein ligase ARI4 [Staphylotrichum longicolle]
MGFSGLLGASSDRAGGPRSIASTASSTDTLPRTPPPDPALRPTPPLPEHIADESHLRPLDPERPDLRELNACLDALAAVFPDVQIEVFRDMFSSFDGESRLALVADALLKNRVTWVKGRWRVAAADGQPADALVPKKETFRSPEYTHAAKTLAWHEFKGLSRSAINAVLAESNYSYLDARQTLVNLSSKSWRFTISSLFLRRKPVSATEAENHPLVIWKPTGRGSIVPTLKSTGNAELDRELFTALIQPLIDRAKTDREAKDHQIAVDLNNAEAEQADGMIECACCFTESAFEEFTSCNADGHMVCFRCVQHCISEAVFGQAWQRSINRETGNLRCPAVDAAECAGCIPQDHMHRAMLQEKNGAEVMHSLQQRLADHSLVASELPLVRCPFCAYAEVDDIYLPVGESDLRFRPDTTSTALVVAFCAICLLFSLPPTLILYTILFLAAAFFILNSRRTLRARLSSEFRAAMVRRRRRRRGLRFVCQGPGCGRASCLSCSKAWTDVHVCHESALVALRTQVEQAMSMAVKRVCPRCNTSFVKTAGCNKLTCPCGYKMCYVCRKDIGGTGDGADVGYRHFCEHFRPHGDPKACDQCTKCNLWEAEDTEEVLRRAKEEVERKWSETERRELSGAEVRFLETGVLSQPAARGVETALRQGKMPTLAEACDCVLELVLV